VPQGSRPTHLWVVALLDQVAHGLRAAQAWEGCEGVQRKARPGWPAPLTPLTAHVRARERKKEIPSRTSYNVLHKVMTLYKVCQGESQGVVHGQQATAGQREAQAQLSTSTYTSAEPKGNSAQALRTWFPHLHDHVAHARVGEDGHVGALADHLGALQAGHLVLVARFALLGQPVGQSLFPWFNAQNPFFFKRL
jgi:hypothetical protein